MWVFRSLPPPRCISRYSRNWTHTHTHGAPPQQCAHWFGFKYIALNPPPPPPPPPTPLPVGLSLATPRPTVKKRMPRWKHGGRRGHGRSVHTQHGNTFADYSPQLLPFKMLVRNARGKTSRSKQHARSLLAGKSFLKIVLCVSVCVCVCVCVCWPLNQSRLLRCTACL